MKRVDQRRVGIDSEPSPIGAVGEQGEPALRAIDDEDFVTPGHIHRAFGVTADLHQRDFTAAEDVIAPLLVTPLVVLDEPLTGTAPDWYIDRLVLITRTRDESCLPTIITNQLLPELLRNPTGATPPPLLSRWLSGLHVHTGGSDVRLRRAFR